MLYDVHAKCSPNLTDGPASQVCSISLPGTLKILQAIERFYHVIKNDVSLHNTVTLLHMTAVLVYK